MRDPLADVMLPEDTSDQLTLRVGTVSGTTPVEVALAGATGLSASHLASYTPVLNDVVAILQTKTDLLILGPTTTGG